MSYTILHVEDSFEALRECPDGEFDVIITDPPYDDHVHKNQISGTVMKKHVNGGSGAIPHLEVKFNPLANYLFAKDLVRVAKRWALSFCAVEAFGEFRRAVGEDYVRGCIWYKMNAQGQMTGDRPAACYEGISIMRHGKKEWNGRGSYGLWACNGTRGEKGRHPNQKPLALCLKLVALFTNRGETVFDPFCGSGRIGEACVLLGRNYVGFDNDPEWVEGARYRLKCAQVLVDNELGWADDAALKLCTAKRNEVLDES